MGLILDTDDPILGLEERRESFYILDRERQSPNTQEYYAQVINTRSEHIFVHGDGSIEVSKDFLRRLVKFFDNPNNRVMLEDGYSTSKG